MTSPTWHSDDDIAVAPFGVTGWCLAVLRGGFLIPFVGFCLVLLLVVRCVERPLFGMRRPVTPYITQFVCRTALLVIGLRYEQVGTPMRENGAVVANHASWLDIFTLNAAQRIYFVAKSEVSGWAGIGWLARATGTVFINRRARDAAKQKVTFEARLTSGHKLLFFPEGTSTDSLRVLPFKPTLFAAFFADALRDTLSIQPVTVMYHAADGMDARYYGWWGDMDFGGHFLRMLATRRHGHVTVTYHDPISVADATDRKALAKQCENMVRAPFEAHTQ